jgi:hypothetical protein
MEFPLERGGRLIAEVDASEVDKASLVLASADPGKVAARATNTLERSLEELRPALSAVLGTLRSVAPSEVGVEFGIKLGGEAGIILAKGTTEVNFAVTITWKNGESE